MSVWYFIAAAYFAWSILIVVGSIGKPRPTPKPVVGVVAVVIYSPVIFLLVYAGLHL
ncbi:hypothetical protein [Clavibacter capsici]|uniref:hypothetical protein n=1 Tax=Clavibacter capsici TaxID=1874630 RepID=UPI00287BA7B0|nr:hypothetical protein [Clavibacter capsici]